MTAHNGHARAGAAASVNGAEADSISNVLQTFDQSHRFGTADITRYTAELEIPFDPRVIEWRVTNSNPDKKRGQVIPYADQRAYTDRLNALFTPAGWTRRYKIHATANFHCSRDQKLAAKVLVICELSIFGFGSNSATGEEWADDDNAGTSAEAQAFKRACSCFGLGRYLYYFEGVWLDLDQRKRPKSIPRLPAWATPAGWVQGLRPNKLSEPDANAATHLQAGSLVSEIEAMARQLGRGLYRGILRDLARVWSPREIQDIAVRQRVLEHMRSAARGLRRLELGVEKAGGEPLVQILDSLGIKNLERIDNLETLKRVVLELERIADSIS